MRKITSGFNLPMVCYFLDPVLQQMYIYLEKKDTRSRNSYIRIQDARCLPRLTCKMLQLAVNDVRSFKIFHGSATLLILCECKTESYNSLREKNVIPFVRRQFRLFFFFNK